MPHIAHDRLSTLVHCDVLDPNGLITSAPVSLERLNLRRKRPGELIERTLRAILLRNSFHMREPTRQRHTTTRSPGQDDGCRRGREACCEEVLSLTARAVGQRKRFIKRV
jgi:hypothetical protein